MSGIIFCDALSAMVMPFFGSINSSFAKKIDFMSNKCKKLQFIHTVNGDGSKTAKIINHTNIAWLSMLV